MGRSLFCLHCFVTAVLWSRLHLFYSIEPVIRLDCQILVKSPLLKLLAGSDPVKSCVWLLLVAVTLPITSVWWERSFSKMKLVKTFPRNSSTTERLGNTDPLSIERHELKNRFRWFRWWIGSRDDNGRIKLHWGDDDKNSNVDCAGICVIFILLMIYLSESFKVQSLCVFRLW